MKRGRFAQIHSEADACEFAAHWREYELDGPCTDIITNSYMKALEILLANGFNVDQEVFVDPRGEWDTETLLMLSMDPYHRCSVEMREMIYNQPDAHITSALAKHSSYYQTIITLHTDILHSNETTSLLLESGAKWPYDIKPKGCVELKRINVAKTKATTLLYGLKGMIPKDVIKQIVTEIYDNRLK